MHWPSPWSEGYPGWHLECSAMGKKYLGEKFDIHGGGMDLLFPHHESEIAQSNATVGHDPVKYWMHNNMITIAGQKMGKSLNNFITLDEFFSGNNELLTQAYSPMTIRFFILQAQYRSTLDFSDAALQAAEKGMYKLLSVIEIIKKLVPSATSSIDVKQFEKKLYNAMNDDFNTPIAIAHLFDLSKLINQVNDGKETISKEDIEFVKNIFNIFVHELLGLKDEATGNNDQLVDQLMDTILAIRKNAKINKDWTTADQIRDELGKINIKVKDTKDGAEWNIG
jgi:cysteinyl-tRNA synthetase